MDSDSESDASDFSAGLGVEESSGQDTEEAYSSEDEKPQKKSVPKKQEASKQAKAKKKPEEKKTSKAAPKAKKEAAAPAGKGKKKDEKEYYGEKEAKEVFKRYMIEQNRPYSLLNVIDNNQGKIKKKMAEQIAEQLVKENVLSFKDYGKSRIFMANQDQFPETSKDELAVLDQEIQEKKDSQADLQKVLKDL